ncbi:LysR family transcriptional regulator [Anaerosporobacter faecicola]|uniref:LysR family transcriptional regulator n=1 Tax=Anaerosporobacter faecicola TaxID=2718714 RepID=UPI0014392926|nr:LysR substrate-binding domain-containing protein [Anaerosporobacter faecicola]
MDLHYLEIFNTVAQYESYKKASDVLHISQPALSIQIKRLEGQIGLKLFDKIGNRIYLNDNGLLLHQYTQKIFYIVHELENTISETNKVVNGTLLIGGSNTPGSYILPDLLGQFKQRYPNSTCNLHINNTSTISQMIAEGSLDIAINGGNCVYNDSIHVERIFNDRLVLVASQKNPAAKQDVLQQETLKNMHFIVHNTDSQLYTAYQTFINNVGIPENIAMCLGNIDAIKRAVNSNLGISLLPYTAVKFEIQHGFLQEINYSIPCKSYPYNLIYNKNKVLSTTSRKFIELIHSEFPMLPS